MKEPRSEIGKALFAYLHATPFTFQTDFKESIRGYAWVWDDSALGGPACAGECDYQDLKRVLKEKRHEHNYEIWIDGHAFAGVCIYGHDITLYEATNQRDLARWGIGLRQKIEIPKYDDNPFK